MLEIITHKEKKEMSVLLDNQRLGVLFKMLAFACAENQADVSPNTLLLIVQSIEGLLTEE